jgi:hypothetical protein|nr:twin-arginine translocation signal domain-containing protein [Mitsuokella multacida]
MDKLSRRSFVKMAGLVAAAAVMPGCSSDEIKKAEGKEEELAKAEPGTGGDHYEAPQGRQGGESVVYFTRDLSAAGLLKLYEKIAPNITGRVGIKLHTGRTSSRGRGSRSSSRRICLRRRSSRRIPTIRVTATRRSSTGRR